MITRDVIATAHSRALSQRRHIRHMLLNVTTVEGAIWRGWRVCLVKHENVHATRPHIAYMFQVIGDGDWRSRQWQVLFEPTRSSGKRTQQRFEAAITETVTHLLNLDEREPDRCLRCEAVITRPGTRVQFCTEACQWARGNAEVRERKRLVMTDKEDSQP